MPTEKSIDRIIQLKKAAIDDLVKDIEKAPKTVIDDIAMKVGKLSLEISKMEKSQCQHNNSV